MLHSVAGCVFCEVDIDERLGRWMGEFRALYIEDSDWTNVQLSGIGLRYISQDQIPRDPLSSYCDPNLNRDSLIHVRLGRDNDDNSPSSLLSTARLWGTPFHASCWNLMVKLLKQEQIDQYQILQCLMSLPGPNSGFLDWGYDYSRKVSFVATYESFVRGLYPDNLPRTSTGVPLYTSDPLAIPEILALRYECSISPDRQDSAPVRIASIQPRRDPFRKLPVEILHMVLEILPSKDVLHFKIASSVVADVYLLESFWASRFSFGHELEYIVEAHNFKVRPFSWKSFYFRVRNMDDNANLENRKRISRVIISLRNFFLEYNHSICSGTPLRSLFERDEDVEDVESSISAFRSLGAMGYSFGLCGRILRCRRALFPKNLKAVFISFITFCGRQYVSGIQFQGDDDAIIPLGYIQHTRELKANIVSSKGDDSYFRLHGFLLAMDHNGIRGISLIISSGESDWLGEHERIPKRRLAASGWTQSLKAGLDAMKIVSLAILEEVPSSSLSLCDKVFWMPVIPPEHLSYNDLMRESPKSNYSFMLFGGSHGENLSKLIRVVVWLVSGYYILGLDFEFNNEVDGRTIHTLGQRGPLTQTMQRPPRYDGMEDRVVSFDIDGPGGERFSQVYVQRWESDYPYVLRICTNRGRELSTGPTCSSEPFVLVDTAQREIVGFFTNFWSYRLFGTFGVISRNS